MTGAPILEAEGLRRSYRARGLRGRGERVVAVDGVDLTLAVGESLGVVGGSGAGKSTLVRLLTALERPDRGVVRFDGHAISAMSESDVRPLRRRFQPVFQDPLASLDPRMRVERSVAEPLAAMGVGSDDRRQRVSELLRQVGLSSDLGRRLPAALSGGERQRAAIARALAPVPELLVLDEPVTSLDATAALELIELLRELQRRLELTLLLVTHDMDVVREFCDRVVVMERGRVVEEGETNRIFAEPRHDSTCALIRAVPRLDI